MTRQVFLFISSAVAISVGLFATAFPSVLLENKGVEPLAGTLVWTRETGLLLVAIGAMAFSMRKLPSSPVMSTFLFVNMAIQAGLLLIELTAYFAGIISEIRGIVPNSVLHVWLGAGFFFYWMDLKSNTKNS